MYKNLTACLLLCIAGTVQAEEGYTAKSLFFGEDGSVKTAATGSTTALQATVAQTTPMKMEVAAKSKTLMAAHKKAKPALQLGASYFIRLKNPDGTTRDVLANQNFKSGDRFQLALKVNHPSYVYILNESPEGKVSQVFPQPGMDNFVNAMGTVFFPSRGAFEFDGQTGSEQLLVYLSPTPIENSPMSTLRSRMPDVVSAPSGYTMPVMQRACAPATPAARAPLEASSGSMDGNQVASIENAYAAKSIAFSDDAAPGCGTASTGTNASGFASKAISFSDDPAPAAGGQVASYVVKTSLSKDQSLYLKLKLFHQ